jgi:hypothetical protein
MAALIPAIVRPMPNDPFIREKFTKVQSAARKHAREYFGRYPKDRYQTKIESRRPPQSFSIEFTMKRLRAPLGGRARVHLWQSRRPAAGAIRATTAPAGMPKGFKTGIDKDGWRH